MVPCYERFRQLLLPLSVLDQFEMIRSIVTRSMPQLKPERRSLRRTAAALAAPILCLAAVIAANQASSDELATSPASKRALAVSEAAKAQQSLIGSFPELRFKFQFEVGGEPTFAAAGRRRLHLGRWLLRRPYPFRRLLQKAVSRGSGHHRQQLRDAVDGGLASPDLDRHQQRNHPLRQEYGWLHHL